MKRLFEAKPIHLLTLATSLNIIAMFCFSNLSWQIATTGIWFLSFNIILAFSKPKGKKIFGYELTDEECKNAEVWVKLCASVLMINIGTWVGILLEFLIKKVIIQA